MIKPVKRNKRLKWPESRYAKRFLPPKIIFKVNARPFRKALRKAIKATNAFGQAMERLNEDTSNIKSFNCWTKGMVKK